MRRQTVIGSLVVVVFAASVGTIRQDELEKPPPDIDTTMARILAYIEVAEAARAVDDAEPPMPAGQAALPEPSFTEPFEIGEALNDPNRVGDAVVSLLALMRIGIVPDGTPMQRITGRDRLRMTEAEVRTLIAMGEVDAEAAAASPDGPAYTFADLHRSLAPFLRGVSVEQLTERYPRAYEKNPDWLVPKVLKGRPVEPDTPMLRTQFWLLLADAVAPVRPPARAGGDRPRLLLAGFPMQQPVAHIWGSGAIRRRPAGARLARCAIHRRGMARGADAPARVRRRHPVAGAGPRAREARRFRECRPD